MCCNLFKQTARLAIDWKIPVYPIDAINTVDISVDGADEDQFPLPIKVVSFSWKLVEKLMKEKGYNPELRLGNDGQLFITDAHHYILDLHLNKIEDSFALNNELDHVTGIVENGLFLGMTERVIIGYSNGYIGNLEAF